MTMTEPRSLEQPSSSGRPFADNLDVRLRDLPPLAGQSDLSGPCPDPYKEPEAGSILVEHNTENSQAAHNGNFRGHAQSPENAGRAHSPGRSGREEQHDPLKKRFWSLQDSQDLLNKEFASPGKTSNLVATSRDGSYTSRRTNSFAARNNSALEVTGGWINPSVLSSRNDIMQSLAVQPSEAVPNSHLVTGFSFSEQQFHSPGGQSNAALLNSRYSHDVENRTYQENLPRAERAISKWDSYPDMRKAVMEDSAQEVDNHSDLLAQQRNLIKASKAESPARQSATSGRKFGLYERQPSHSPKLNGQRSKPSLTKAQTEFIGNTLRREQQKKASGIFARPSGHSAHHKQASQYSPLNKLDARNDKAMNSHDRIMAWLEQGERYMQGLQAVPFASSKALMEAPASMTTSRSKVASKAAKHKDSKRKAKWLCSLPCLAA